MCDMLFSQLCLRLPTTNQVSSGRSKCLEHHFGNANEIHKSDSESYTSGDNFLIHGTTSMAALVLRGYAIVPMQLVAHAPTSLFYWPLIQLAVAACDDIALGVAVGSEGRSNLPGATSDIRAALLLLLIGKCTADSTTFMEVEGEEFTAAKQISLFSSPLRA